jgi:hypothetical protein
MGWGGVDWIGLVQDRDQLAGCCEYSDETIGFLKCGEFLEQFRTYWLLRKDSVHEFSCCSLIYSFIYSFSDLFVLFII